MSTTEIINPAGWPAPKGYSNGIIGEGRMLFIGGQIGWTPDNVFKETTFVGQFDQALANTLAVLNEAGGEVSNIVRMTIYVTDIETYRSSLRDLGPVWRKHMGRWYPAMALVAVTDLVEADALLEIETTAALPLETVS
ncbi:MAG: enamine deaminase RidA [Myxococcales bacterium]|nr:enamine deaminase RidA [Myxococcales bacterium]|tara:strand:+ start:205 stop:618 length:414 start_codon:yes stop_codon:yes gene_type:complete